MPRPMRQLAAAMLCQWYAMFAYWQYVTFAIGRSIYNASAPASAAFREATLTAQQAGALYNFFAFLGSLVLIPVVARFGARHVHAVRSEEHTSELQSLMRISYAVFCLKKKKHHVYKCI